MNLRKYVEMALKENVQLDDTDWRILEELQSDARISFSELGRRVNLSSPAVAERVRRMENAGIISGYQTRIGFAQLGLNIVAFLTLKSHPGQSAPAGQAIKERPEVLECHAVTGVNCYIMKIAVESVQHLEKVVVYLSRFGEVTTSVVLSSLVDDWSITSPTNTKRLNFE